MERTCLFFYVMLYLLFYFEAEKVKKDVKTSINLIKICYETCFFPWKVCQCPKSPYICNVFFIVLDLRLTKVGARRCSFFYVCTLRFTYLFGKYTIKLYLCSKIEKPTMNPILQLHNISPTPAGISSFCNSSCVHVHWFSGFI
mgnify:CR=1 FL=1